MSVVGTVIDGYAYASAAMSSMTAHRLFTMRDVMVGFLDELTERWPWGTMRTRRFVVLLGFTVFWPYGVYQMIKKGVRG